MNKRLLKILSLLESTNDAEALQALRTAQRILTHSKLTLAGVAENYLQRSQPSEVSPLFAQLIPLQAELNRYRAALEQAVLERDEHAREVTRLQAFLREKDSLKLFQRLRDREDNIASLTRELRRLKDELFQLERRLRAQGDGATRSRRSRKGDEQHVELTAVSFVQSWVDLCALKASSDAKDWTSARSLYDMFLEGRVSFQQGRQTSAESAESVASGAAAQLRLGQKEFCLILAKILGQEPVTGSRGLASGKGFCVYSDLAVVTQEEPDFRAAGKGTGRTGRGARQSGAKG